MKFKSLKSNILLYLILFAIIPLLIASSILLNQLYTEKKLSLFTKHSQILKQVINESDSIIDTIEQLGQYTKDYYTKRKYNMLTDLMEVQKNITTVLILNNKGILKDYSSSIKSNLFIGFDYSNMKYFKNIKDGATSYWTTVYLSQATQKPSISYVLRIDDNNIAVLIVDLSRLNDFAKKFQSDDGSTMVRITDSDGIFLAHPARPKAVQQRKSIRNMKIYTQFIANNFTNKQIIYYGTKELKNIGVYGKTDKLNWTIIVKERYDFIFDTFNTLLILSMIFILFLIIVSVYFSLKLSKSILKPLGDLSSSMDKIAHGKGIEKLENTNFSELEKLSTNFLIMQDMIKDREELNRQKDKQLYDSVKMVQMGEMIGNIAHQWRQPLSVISTAASGMKMEKEFNMLTDEKMYSYCDAIGKNTEYLSNTIDTFRDFIKEKKEYKEVVIQDRIDHVLNILDSSLSNCFIAIINNIDYDNKIKLKLVVGELSQVIINIINNAKDVLVQKKIENPYIRIGCTTKNNSVIITLEDNGGGIPLNVLPRIFEPYFTTKHQSQGTGLGLHMSQKIISESLGGKLYAINTENGAKFFIELPLS